MRRETGSAACLRRFWEKVSQSDAESCWPWLGARKKLGYPYGFFSAGRGGHLIAHRFAWEIANAAKVPAGAVIRHQCDNPTCVNPRHLQSGTQAENLAEMHARGRGRKKQRPPICKNGHPMTGDGLYITPAGHARCRVCARNQRTAYERDSRRSRSRAHSSHPEKQT